MNNFLRPGSILVSGNAIGSVVRMLDDGLLVDFGDSERVIEYKSVDWKKTAIYNVIRALDKLIDVYGQEGLSVKKKPVTEEEIVLPSTPKSPEVQKLPPKPPRFPEHLEVPRPSVSILTDVDKFTQKVLENLQVLMDKRLEVQTRIDNLNSQLKEVRTLLKEIELEQKMEIKTIVEHLRKVFEGNEELGHYFGKFRDQLLYIVRYVRTEKEEAPPDVLLEALLNIVKEEAPRKFDVISKRLEKVKKEAENSISELLTYFAEVPLASIKGSVVQAQVISKIRQIFRSIMNWLRVMIRKIVGWFSDIESSLEQVVFLSDEIDKVIKKLS